MRKILAFAMMIMLLTAAVFNSCQKGDIEKTFDLELNDIVLNADSLTGPIDTTFTSQVITTGIEAKLNQWGATLQKVKKIELKSADLTITNPAGRTFDGIEYIHSYVTASGLGETKVAYKINIPQTGINTISMDNQYADVTDYIKQDEFNFIVKGYCNQPIPAMTYDLDIKFTVTAMVAQ